ncbi:MAG: hypothetical protein K6B75_01250, partial [Lachnospiraceae bacterium]|nr:hypothetical protein [Lachnospiraceae bacterium]
MSKQYRVGCTGLDEYGRGLCKFNNKIFAVPYFLKGEKGNIELVHGKEVSARLTLVDQASPDRVEPGCDVYEKCGGCSLMHMKYEAQLRFKQDMVEGLFPEEKKAGLIENIISMENPFFYRHKIYATIQRGQKGEIKTGIYEDGSHRVVTPKECRIQNREANKIIRSIAKIMKQTNTPPYNEDRKSGVLRHAYIRVAKGTGEIMVVLVTGSLDFKARKIFVSELTKAFKGISTIIWNINTAKTGMVLGKSNDVLFGKGYIEEELCGKKFI